MHLALTVVDWIKNRDKRVLYVFRRVPTRSSEREVGARSFLKELRETHLLPPYFTCLLCVVDILEKLE